MGARAFPTAPLAAFLPAAACLLLLSACSLMPVGSWLGGSSPAPGELARLDPAEFRAAVKLPLPVRPRPGTTLLKIVVTPRSDDAKPEKRTLLLSDLANGAAPQGLPDAGPGYRWYTFELPPPGRSVLRSLQAALGEPGSVSTRWARTEIRLQSGYENAAPGTEISRDVWLRIGTGEDYTPLALKEKVRVERRGPA